MIALRLVLALLLAIGWLAGGEAPGVVGNPDAPVTGVAGTTGGAAPAAPTRVDPAGAVSPALPNPGQLKLTLDAGGGADGLSNAVTLLLVITVLAVAPGFVMFISFF